MSSAAAPDKWLCGTSFALWRWLALDEQRSILEVVVTVLLGTPLALVESSAWAVSVAGEGMRGRADRSSASSVLRQVRRRAMVSAARAFCPYPDADHSRQEYTLGIATKHRPEVRWNEFISLGFL